MKKLFLVLTTFFSLATCNILTAQVNANFGWEVNAMFCGNMQVSFSDSSTGFVTSWYWDFGNGGTSTLQNPTTTYTTGSVYSVTLIVNDSGGNKDTLLQDSIITVPFPLGTFTFTPTSGSLPLTVCFYANTINTTSYIWDFGDGIVLNSIGDTCHTYLNTGIFNPILILQNTLPTGAPCSLLATNLTGQVTVDSTAGVNESQKENLKLKVYPNPAKKEITVEMTSAPAPAPKGESYVVRIKNSLGQEITQRVIPSGARNLTMDTSQFPKGLLLVEVCTPSQKEKGTVCHTEKVVIE